MSDAINTLSAIEQIEFNLTQIEAFRNEHARQTLNRLVKVHVLDAMYQKMRSQKYSEKIIASTRLDRIEILPSGEAEIYIISDYKSESGFDVSEAREEGTKDHHVAPDTKLALSFFINGERVFSKGHDVTGIKASHIVSDTILLNTDIVQSEFDIAESQWIKETLQSR